MRGDRPLVGHPEDRPVGPLTGQLEHVGPERGNEDGRGLDVGDVERVVDPEQLVLDIERSRTPKGHVEHVEVRPHGERRTVVAQAEHVLDDPVMGDAQPEAQAAVETAWTDSAAWARATGWRGWTGTTAVPTSIRLVASPTTVAATRASKSSGIWGTHTEDRPAASAQRASSRSRSTLVAYRPRSGPIITPMRIAGLLGASPG